MQYSARQNLYAQHDCKEYKQAGEQKKIKNFPGQRVTKWGRVKNCLLPVHHNAGAHGIAFIAGFVAGNKFQG